MRLFTQKSHQLRVGSEEITEAHNQRADAPSGGGLKLLFKSDADFALVRRGMLR
jgi:dihydrodipicolinate reductase